MAQSARSFFILCCARSGSTSLANILDTATNGTCAVEPYPGLHRASRQAMMGLLEDPEGELRRTILPRVSQALQSVEIYGEKDLTYGPFIPQMHQLLNCRFVFLKRDGRDVVRSMMDWHNRMFGTIYRECRDPGDLSDRAMAAASGLPAHEDLSDYSRPRPLPDHPLYQEWENLSREEMCAYYWATINDLFHDRLEQIPFSDWTELNYTEVESKEICDLASFLNLMGVDESHVSAMLNKRINSLTDRTKESNEYPSWQNWSSSQRDRFERIAGPTMARLGYFSKPELNWCPKHFQWPKEGKNVSVLSSEISGYLKEHSKRLSPTDISSTVAYSFNQRSEWLSRLRSVKKRHPEHLRMDCLSGKQHDVVISENLLNHSYDVDAHLKAITQAARKWLVVSCFASLDPEQNEHHYNFSAESGEHHNDLSLSRILEVMKQTGCTEIRIDPMGQKRSRQVQEVCMTARVA